VKPVLVYRQQLLGKHHAQEDNQVRPTPAQGPAEEGKPLLLVVVVVVVVPGVCPGFPSQSSFPGGVPAAPGTGSTQLRRMLTVPP